MTPTDAGAAGTAYWFLDTLTVVHSATPPLVIETLEGALGEVGVSVVGPSMTAAEADAIASPAASHSPTQHATWTEAVPDIAERHRRALQATGKIVANIGPGQWAAPTPCDGWDVRALVNHLVSGNLWAAELASGRPIADVADRLDGDLLGADPRRAYDASAAAAAIAFTAPGALEAPCAVSYGPVPGSVYAGHRFLDVLIHGWDLAVASGQDATLDPILVDACHEVITPQADLLRASGAFGRKIDPPDVSDAQTRLLATLGRRA